MPTTLHENRPSATLCGDRRGRGAKTHGFFCDFCGARATLCGDRRGRGAKTRGFLRFLKFPRDPLWESAWSRCKNPWFFPMFYLLAHPLRESAWSRCKNPWFFAMFNLLARPSAGIGVVEVQKLEVFCDFRGARATLCGDRRGRGAKTRGFLRFLKFPRDPLRESAWSRCKNPWFFPMFNLLAHPLRESAWSRGKNPWFFAMFNLLARPSAGSAWSRCKNSRFFAISAVLAQPSAGIGVVEVQKLGFLRLLLFELVLGSCLVVRAPAPGTGGSRVRFLPGPRAGVARCNLHFKATCAEQLAQSNLRRASCTEQLAQTNLHRPVCAERLA